MKIFKSIMKIGITTFFTIIMAMCFSVTAKADVAEELDYSVEMSNGGSGSNIKDGSYHTSVNFNAGDYVTIHSEQNIYGFYVVWGLPVEEWTLSANGTDSVQGKNEFLHDYIEFSEGVTEFTMKMDNGNQMLYIECYGEGELPEDVQVWEPSCEKADILLISSHADDEILFFGPILPIYAREKDMDVQVAYFSQYWTGATIREHEKLDGLWHSGVRNYPVTADFDDYYADDLEHAKELFGYDKTLDWIVSLIREFKPQVVVCQDFDGEYGHGTHKLTAAATAEAVEISMDENSYPESAQLYGVWDVPKTYVHIYQENQIVLPCREPLASFDGKTALEIAQESYLKHVSQQWCWYYVDDEYEYSCAKYGLYRSTVGADTGNDMMENLKSYKVQEEERLKAEQESIAKEEAESESMSIAEAESISEAASIEAEREAENKADKEKRNTILIIVLVVVVVIFVPALIYFFALVRAGKQSDKARNKRRKRRK